MTMKNCMTRSSFILLALFVSLGLSSCNKKLFKKKSKNVEPVATSTSAKPSSMNDPIDDTEEEAVEIEEVEEPIRTTPKKPSIEVQLSSYFNAISGANSTAAANSNISEALDLFSDTDAPVLIVIYRDGARPAYDEPTTISKYLNYLKDTKNNKAKVEEIVYDENGLIKELVLKK